VSQLLVNQLSEWKKFWRLAEMRVLFLALLVAVVAVTSVGFFTDRADRAMSQQATTMLGGDMVVVSTRPISDAFLQEAEKRGLGTAETISFPSMVSVLGDGEKFQLAQIKAVSLSYPLHGAIETSEDVLGEVSDASLKELANNETLAESRLFIALDVKAGQIEDALRGVEEIKRRYPKLPAGFILEGDIHASRKQSAGAASAYAKARELGGGTQTLLKEIAALQSKLIRFAEAIQNARLRLDAMRPVMGSRS